MSSATSQLNLSPQERRLVAGVGLVVFIILNIWLVWPRFSDWKKIQSDQEKAERTLARYQTEVGRVNLYQARLRDLESQGSRVVPENQELDLANTVLNFAQENHVTVTRSEPVSRLITAQTNQFFEEQGFTVSVTSTTEELVSFLVSLTSTNSLIRVWDMTLSPDPPQAPTRIAGKVTLIASYQKQPPVKAAPVVAPQPAVKAPSTAARNTNAAAARPGTQPAGSASKTAITKTGTNNPAPTKPKPGGPNTNKN